MLSTFEFLAQILSKELANSLTMLSRWVMSPMSDVLMLLSDLVSSLMKVCSSLLFLMIEHFLVWACLLQFKDLRVSQWIEPCIRVNTRELNRKLCTELSTLSTLYTKTHGPYYSTFSICLKVNMCLTCCITSSFQNLLYSSKMTYNCVTVTSH